MGGARLPLGFVSHELAVMAGVLPTGETEELKRLRQVEAAELLGAVEPFP